MREKKWILGVCVCERLMLRGAVKSFLRLP